MNVRRGAAGAVAAVLGILFTIFTASPVAAAPAGSFDSPATDGEKFTESAVTFAGRFTASDGGRLEGNLVLEVAGQRFEKPVGETASAPFEWTVTIPANGEYEAVATAMYRDWPYQLNAAYPHTIRRKVVVEAMPAAVKSVTTSVKEADRTVTVKWAPNSEPDLVGYVVSRSYNSTSSFAAVKAVPKETTTYADKLTADDPAGTYRYQVRAVRKTAQDNDEVLIGEPTTSKPTAVKTAPPSNGTTPTTGTGSAGGAAGGQQQGGTKTPAGGALPANGRVDVAKFNNLLGSASLGPAPSSSPLTPGPELRIEEEDGGFSERLPYGPDGIPGTEDDGQALMEVGVDEPVSSSDERPTTLLSLGGAALAAMLVALTRWILNEVKRTEDDQLAPVEPEVSAAALAELVEFTPPVAIEETPVPPRRVRPLRSPMRPPRIPDEAAARELVGTAAE